MGATSGRGGRYSGSTHATLNGMENASRRTTSRPPERSREIASLVPQAQLVLVPRCGHMLTMEQPQVVNATLAAWLSSLGN